MAEAKPTLQQELEGAKQARQQILEAYAAANHQVSLIKENLKRAEAKADILLADLIQVTGQLNAMEQETQQSTPAESAAPAPAAVKAPRAARAPKAPPVASEPAAAPPPRERAAKNGKAPVEVEAK